MARVMVGLGFVQSALARVVVGLGFMQSTLVRIYWLGWIAFTQG